MTPAAHTLRLRQPTLGFSHVPLRLVDDGHEHVFAYKNNRTLRDTLARQRYRRLAEASTANYSDNPDSALGEDLLQLKLSDDPFYRWS